MSQSENDRPQISESELRAALQQVASQISDEVPSIQQQSDSEDKSEHRNSDQ